MWYWCSTRYAASAVSPVTWWVPWWSCLPCSRWSVSPWGVHDVAGQGWRLRAEHPRGARTGVPERAGPHHAPPERPAAAPRDPSGVLRRLRLALVGRAALGPAAAAAAGSRPAAAGR